MSGGCKLQAVAQQERTGQQRRRQPSLQLSGCRPAFPCPSTSAQPECLLQTACCTYCSGERLCCHVRRQHVGLDDLDWWAIAGHLGRSEQAVRSKYRHQKVVQDGSGHKAPAAVLVCGHGNWNYVAGRMVFCAMMSLSQIR